MKLFVLSDLHIRGVDDPLYAQLLKVIQQRLEPGDVLVLAGDIFDLFIGEKESFWREYSAFMDAVREAGRRGGLIHYIEGNHDFLMRRAFSGMEGVQVHPCEVNLELAGKRFYIAHGDLIDRQDYAYRALRAVFRSLALKAAVQVMPEKLVEFIGKRSSHTSKANKAIFADHLLPERREQLRKLCRSFAEERVAAGFEFVVLGHCHDLDELKITTGAGARNGHYYNVGYPPVHGKYLEWTSGAEGMKRVSFN